MIMDEVSSTIAASLADYFDMVRERVHQWVGPISEERLWRRPYPYGNSAGHLLLHLTGNLNYYIGARIAGTGYVRDRDREFTDTERRPKAEVLAAFDRAITMVKDTIRRQSEADWPAPYSAERAEAKDRFSILLDCAGHAYHHVGQLVYLSKEWASERTEDDRAR
jgi:uncharacterized damage-inducible protein DinB